MTGSLRRATIPGVLAAAVAAASGGVALAHESSAPTSTEIVDVDVPGGGLEAVISPADADLLVLRWSGPGTLEVLDDEGDAFLRLDPDGVEGDHGELAWYETNDPLGVVDADPAVLDGTAPDDWRAVADEPTWSLFDHRLHPGGLAAPSGSARSEVLAEWEVPLRVDGRAGAIRGRVVSEPLLGSYRARLTATPDDERFLVQLVPGDVPALFGRALGGATVVVEGGDGEPFLRFGPDAVEANQASPTWLTHARLARIALPEVPADATAAPVWRPVADGPAYTWLDPRAGPGVEGPPEDPSQAAVVARWAIPVTVDGEAGELAGTTAWAPLRTPGDDDGDGGLDPVTLAVRCGLAALAALGVGALWNRRTRRARS